MKTIYIELSFSFPLGVLFYVQVGNSVEFYAERCLRHEWNLSNKKDLFSAVSWKEWGVKHFGKWLKSTKIVVFMTNFLPKLPESPLLFEQDSVKYILIHSSFLFFGRKVLNWKYANV